MASDYISAINTYLKEKVTLGVSVVYQDSFPDDGTLEIMTRHETTLTNVKRYYNEKFRASVAFSYYVKAKSLKDVQAQCQKIIGAITGTGVLIGSEISADIELKSEAFFVSQYETGEYVYCVPFEVQFIKE